MNIDQAREILAPNGLRGVHLRRPPRAAAGGRQWQPVRVPEELTVKAARICSMRKRYTATTRLRRGIERRRRGLVIARSIIGQIIREEKR